MEEFVFDFTEDGSVHPIDVVAEITGLTYDEIRSCSDTMKTDYDPEDGYSFKITESASSTQTLPRINDGRTKNNKNKIYDKQN